MTRKIHQWACLVTQGEKSDIQISWDRPKFEGLTYRRSPNRGHPMRRPPWRGWDSPACPPPPAPPPPSPQSHWGQPGAKTTFVIIFNLKQWKMPENLKMSSPALRSRRSSQRRACDPQSRWSTWWACPGSARRTFRISPPAKENFQIERHKYITLGQTLRHNITKKKTNNFLQISEKNILGELY